MSNVDRWRPPREGYVPPSLPAKPPPAVLERASKSPASAPLRRRIDVPPAVPSPPKYGSRTSPPQSQSHRSQPSPSQPSPARPPPPRPNQWFFTYDEVVSSPSIAEGLPIAEERLRRAKGVNFIYQVGVILELPQITLWVAGVFFHRFYMRCSLQEEKGGVHQYNIAATSLFLANKTEENCRKTRELIIAVVKVAQKNAKLIIDEQSKEYWRWRDSILTYEELMLETLTFDLMVDNPYQRLFDHLNKLRILHNKRLREAAWAFLNDSCLTILPLLMEARDISIASIFFASSVIGEPIEDIDDSPWWVCLKASEDTIIKAVEIVTEFYKENPLKRQDSRSGSASPVFKLENTRRRGETITSQTEAGSSANGSPLGIDRDTQSPLNGKGEKNGDATDVKESGEDAAAEPASQISRENSDATMKAAANDLTVHDGKPNGSDIQSPAPKRNLDLDVDSDGERRQKRAKTADGEEGESKAA